MEPLTLKKSSKERISDRLEDLAGESLEDCTFEDEELELRFSEQRRLED
jgi:hypothetical protein